MPTIFRPVPDLHERVCGGHRLGSPRGQPIGEAWVAGPSNVIADGPDAGRTLAEVAAFGLPMVVVPYPHAAGHQRLNAEAMVRAGAARLVEDADFDATALLAAVDILDDSRAHDEMAAAARSLARPGAADAVAELVMAAAERRPLPDAAMLESISRGVAL